MYDKEHPLCYLIAGSVGGLFTVLTGHPFDTMKVRLQTMPIPKPGETPMYLGTWDCFTKMIKEEGVRGLYKGVSAPLTAVLPFYSLSFFGFGLAKMLIKGDDTLSALTKPQLYIAGAFSGLLSSIVVGPVDRIKCLLQVQRGEVVPKKYANAFDCARSLYAEGGLRNIFKGTGATMLRDIPASGFFYMTYEWLQEELVPDNASGQIKTLATIFSGGLAGIANWIVAMPADVLKSRLQAAPFETYPNGARDVFKQLMKKEGPHALYKGIVPVLIRAFPANAVCFLGFELGMNVQEWAALKL